MAKSVEATFDDKELKDFFANLRIRLLRVKGAETRYMGLLSALVYQDVQDHFKREEGSGGPWAAWSLSYRKRMQKIGRSGNKILQWSGKLRQNFKPSDWRRSGESFIWFNDAKTKSGFPYAWLHEEGGPNHPQRDFMWLSSSAVEKIADQTLNFILEEQV